MGDANQIADVAWRDGIPVALRFDDPYYSAAGGLAEARHVFVAGNGLPERMRTDFHIAELGFGTGLNALATAGAAAAWIGPERIRYTAFEAYPMAAADMARALATFPEVDAAPLLAAWPATHFSLGHLEVEIVLRDARLTLPQWGGHADAWFLDGFSPARNPEMWSDALMAEVGRHTAPGGTFATYTAAGHVRRALDVAGFDVARVPGYGRKRHMTRGVLR